jgi:hypothetical protein
VISYGASVTQNVSFNSFSELFKKITGRKSAQLKINDSDDFLRNDYKGEENWTPLDLQNLPPRKDLPLPLNREMIPTKEDY